VRLKDALCRWLGPPTLRLGLRIPLRPVLLTMRRLNRIQLSAAELAYLAALLRARGPCNLLVFGLGNDSAFWSGLNAGGRTVFIEDDPAWLEKAGGNGRGLPEAYQVEYRTQRSQWEAMLEEPPRLEMDWPPAVAAQRWEVILVDGPAGWNDRTPGRMKSIFAAPRLAAKAADILVHDCDRPLERAYSDRFLGAGNLRREIGRLRHYRLV
jgi:hypothetical protein